MIRRILVIDDDPLVRELVRASLTRATGWDVVSAASGPEGIAIALADPPDVILLDLMMPGMGGAATRAALLTSEATTPVPVIVLSAGSAGTFGQELLPDAIAGVIAKPFDFLGLAGEVAGTMGWTL